MLMTHDDVIGSKRQQKRRSEFVEFRGDGEFRSQKKKKKSSSSSSVTKKNQNQTIFSSDDETDVAISTF